MKIFHSILFTTLFLCLTSCGASPDDDDSMAKKLVCSQISELTTTSNALGSFTGNQVPNVQQDDLDPGEYTIQFQVIEPPVDGLGFATYGLISWKIAGQQIQRIISVFNGSAISGVADSVHVTLLDQSNRSGSTTVLTGTFSVTNGLATFTSSIAHTFKAGQLIQFTNQPNVFYTVVNGMVGTTGILDRPFTGATNAAVTAFTLSSYKVGVILSRGTRPTTMQPAVLQTNPVITLNPSTSTTINLPTNDAGIISILMSATVPGPAGTNQDQAEQAVVEFLALNLVVGRFIPNEFSGWFPVPAGTTSIKLYNNSVVTQLDFTLQWGIEG